MSATQVHPMLHTPILPAATVLSVSYGVSMAVLLALQPLLGTAVPHIHSKHGASVHLRHVTSIIRIASACHSIAIFQFLVVAPVVFVGLAGTLPCPLARRILATRSAAHTAPPVNLDCAKPFHTPSQPTSPLPSRSELQIQTCSGLGVVVRVALPRLFARQARADAPGATLSRHAHHAGAAPGCEHAHKGAHQACVLGRRASPPPCPLPAAHAQPLRILQGNSALQISELGLDQTYGAVHVRAEAQKVRACRSHLCCI